MNLDDSIKNLRIAREIIGMHFDSKFSQDSEWELNFVRSKITFDNNGIGDLIREFNDAIKPIKEKWSQFYIDKAKNFLKESN